MDYESKLFDADIKLSEANVEGLRDMRERLSSLDQSLNELISKATSVQQTIADSVNQTRTRIVG